MRAPSPTPFISHPIDAHLRPRLEHAFRTDLEPVRVHTYPAARRAARQLGADAFAYGIEIALATEHEPESDQSLWLLAHEVAHVVQQSSGRARTRSRQALEDEASRAADRVLAGRAIPADLLGVRVAAARHRLVQCHDSFEHRAIGDVGTSDLVQMTTSGSPAVRTQLLHQQIGLQWLWQANPESVTAEQIQAHCPGILTLRLAESDLLVTYGELNALPDYIANAGTADTIPKATLLPILQFIRQESYIQFNKLLDVTATTPFQGAVFTPNQWAPGLLNKLLESSALDTLTSALGVDNVDHYSGLLGRNACHFAPFSWYRWQSNFLIALDLAQQANETNDPNQQAQLTRQAWVRHGYADHFLQDSFAAGHLVNKTLIMQWFVEWAAGKISVFDWTQVQQMTTTAQPGLAGRDLYSFGPAMSNDPQTAEEQVDYWSRFDATLLQAGQSGTLEVAYQDYFMFLSSLITQSSSAAIHDWYNQNSLWVSSITTPTPYEIWGDDTFFSGVNGGTGASEVSLAAQLSQQAIRDMLTSGSTKVTTQEIVDRFPTQVQVSGQLLGLEAWNDTQQTFCNATIFPSLHDVVVRLSSPLIANVSQDEDLAARWNTSLPGTGFTKTSVLPIGDQLYAASDGYVFALDPTHGTVLSRLLVTGTSGVGDYETRLAGDGQRVYVGVHGYVYAVTLVNGSLHLAWTANLPSTGYNTVDVLVTGGSVYAGSNGYVFQLDPGTGRVVNSRLLGSLFGSGDYTMRLVAGPANGPAVIAGTHGWAYGLTAGLGLSWQTSLPNGGYHLVELLVTGDALYAGTNGYVYLLNTVNGSVQASLLVTDTVGAGDYTTTLASDGTDLYIGVHGYVYAITSNNWQQPTWSADLAGNRYSMVNVVCDDGELLAGSYGYVFRIDPGTGQVIRSTLLTYAAGVGEYETRLAFAPGGGDAYAGVHGYAYRVSALTPS